jgi:hypothetical protein
MNARPISQVLLGGQICVMKCSVRFEICSKYQLFNYFTDSVPRYTKEGKPAGSAGSAGSAVRARIEIGKKDAVVAVGVPSGL